jgi:hypothetical protein
MTSFADNINSFISWGAGRYYVHKINTGEKTIAESSRVSSVLPLLLAQT